MPARNHPKKVARTCGQVTPGGFEGMATVSTLSAFEGALVCASGQPGDEPVLCRAAVQLAPTATGVMMYMPGGLQTITPIDGGLGQPITVRVDGAGAAALNQQHAAIMARGKRPMFDFNHEDGPASFWPAEYFWAESPEPGIYCRGEWTASGKAGVEGREWRQFSPVFHVSKKLGATPQNPAAIICRTGAKANMGGLVNDPAFHTILPLWAKNAPGAHPEPTNQNQTDMTPEELAALQAKNKELQTELDALRAKDSALKAKNETDALVQSEIRAKELELKAGKAEERIAAITARNTTLESDATARAEADADAAVNAAVARGAIAAKDEPTKKSWRALICANAGAAALLAAVPGATALGGRITQPNIQITTEAPNAVMKNYAAILARNAALPLSHETHKAKGQLAREASAVFAKDIRDDAVISSMSIDEALKAADYSDPAGNVGLLSGTLAIQRALELFQFEYPIINSISDDFSDAPGLLNQTEVTRITLKPAVQTRSTAVDSAGRPVGWTTVSPAQTVDVPVTLSAHVGVPVVFGQNILASTVRNLFAEQAPMALYALGGYAVDMLTALMTAANFNAYAGTSIGTGATTSGSNAITFASNAIVYPGQAISGTGVPSNTYIASVQSATAATMTQAATATNTGLTFTLNAGKVPTTYVTYIKALASFAMASLADVKAAFDSLEVPMQNRFALLNSAYYAKLTQDSAFNTFWAAMQSPDVISKGKLPPLQGIAPINAPYFPTGSNRTGFVGHKSALILKSRLPNDIIGAVGAQVPGNVTTISAPGGLSVMLVQYASLREGYAEWRPEVLLGAAVGDRRGGLVITSS